MLKLIFATEDKYLLVTSSAHWSPVSRMSLVTGGVLQAW